VTDVFEQLLAVQEDDTAIDQLRHRRATLPEQAELTAVEGELALLAAADAERQAVRAGLGARQAALEEQIEQSRTRRAELERRAYGGAVAAGRDLVAIDDEIKHLARHISDLEDREIEVMEALEPLDADIAADAAAAATYAAERDRLRQVLAATVADIDAEIAARTDARRAAAGAIPPDLLTRYEALRTKLGGTGAARLVGSSCGGCHLTLPAVELDHIRKAPPDAVITCDQCGRILVRSG